MSLLLAPSEEPTVGEPIPIIINIFDKNVVPRIVEASNCLDQNDEEGAKRVVCDMIRAGYIQLIFPTEIRSGLVAEDTKMQ